LSFFPLLPLLQLQLHPETCNIKHIKHPVTSVPYSLPSQSYHRDTGGRFKNKTRRYFPREEEKVPAKASPHLISTSLDSTITMSSKRITKAHLSFSPSKSQFHQLTYPNA
jgi:hypothetical protein